MIPSNEGRGYVQRRIIRRAIRHGYKLGRKQPFFHKLVPDLVKLMGEAYPHLAQGKERIMDVLKAEEERFYETLANGMDILDSALAGGQTNPCAMRCEHLGEPAAEALRRAGHQRGAPGQVEQIAHDASLKAGRSRR